MGVMLRRALESLFLGGVVDMKKPRLGKAEALDY